MGLKPLEVKALTLKDFNLMYTGYFRRQEKEWNRTRHVMAFILNYGGMGAKQFQKPQDIWPLEMDKQITKRRIRTMAQAMSLLKEYHAATRVSD